jgi:hypothetical protein
VAKREKRQWRFARKPSDENLFSIVKFRVRKVSNFSQGYITDFELGLKYVISGVAESDRQR